MINTYDEPAFPLTDASCDTSRIAGMSLRDYFAAKAMQALIYKEMISHNRDEYAVYIAAFAYEVADAMLLERNPE